MRGRWLLVVVVAASAACSGSSSTSSLTTAPLPTALADLLAASDAAGWLANGDDAWEVWVCHVPLDSTAEVYAGLQIRLDIEPQGVADLLNRDVTAYFDTLSSGLYRPRFTAGGEVSMTATDEPQACLDAAFTQSRDTTRAIIALADAEHGADQPGGFGTAGGPCAQPPCPVRATRRAAYVGAADFHADWGDRPPMDLVEHEIGHTLGWPHSGYDPTQAEPHQSALDVMSNSASPRDVDPERRDAPDTLALNKLIAGWLPLDAVVAIPADGGTVHLQPSNGGSGTRLAVASVDATRFLTVEVLSARGFDAHLPASGVAVHEVRYDDVLHDPLPLVGAPPYSDLLSPGESVDAGGWRIAVINGWTVTFAPI